MFSLFGQLFSLVRSLRMDFESRIFPRIGAFGRYNRIVVFFTWIPNFAVAFNLFSNVFFTLMPESYHCAPDPSLLPAAWPFSNLSEQESLNFTIPWVKGSGLSHCELYKYPANFTNFTDNMPRETVACTRGWEYTEAAGLHSNYVTQVSMMCTFYLHCWKLDHMYEYNFSRALYQIHRELNHQKMRLNGAYIHMVYN